MVDTETLQRLIPQLLTYSPDTGDLYWKPRPPTLFTATATRTAEHMAANWNAKHAGQKALTAVGSHGYKSGRVMGRGLLAHRVIYCLMTGQWPTHEIDHVNGDRTDNRWRNLRQATRAQNNRNLTGYATTSPYIGVYWNKSLGGYMARVYHEGRSHYCGFSRTDPEKIARRRDAKAKELFGEFARLNFEE